MMPNTGVQMFASALIAWVCTITTGPAIEVEVCSLCTFPRTGGCDGAIIACVGGLILNFLLKNCHLVHHLHHLYHHLWH